MAEKYTQRQISEMFIYSIEEAKETAKQTANTEKRIKQNLENFEQDFFKKARTINVKVDTRDAESTLEDYKETFKNAHKIYKITYYAYGLLGAGLILILFNFWFLYLHIETKTEIKEKLLTELKKNGQLKTPEEDAFIKAYIKWERKNPNDSYNFRTKIDKVK